ncbi:protein NO VEIN domain-containing protein [Halomonas sp. B23F22_10]|uniref:protein NO VEIN domain-containing protein n=1 Tax=Halomonas sp. B23F22_10 TaxID=3459515 RepID=UPI00373E3D90
MSRKIALKRLTKSDLTIFDYHFRLGGAGHQKSINLNRNILEGKFYQNLTEVAVERDWEPFILNLTILGPGVSNAHTLPQKIIKGGSAKNWRLNGKMIQSPDDEERYAPLSEGDFAIMEFIGAAWPTSMRMTLVTSDLEEDTALHSELSRNFPLNIRKSMTVLGVDDLEKTINSVSDRLSNAHPIRDFLEAFDLEDAAQGGPIGTNRLNKRRKGRGVSQEELRKAKKAAEIIGRQGEEILDTHFLNLKDEGLVEDYAWVADTNAVSPFDFTCTMNSGQKIMIDAKSTGGPFSNTLHISLSELYEMAENSCDYHLYRLYEVKDGFARMKISAPMKDFAGEVLSNLESLPDGVLADSVSVNPEKLSFGEEQILDFNAQMEQV